MASYCFGLSHPCFFLITCFRDSLGYSCVHGRVHFSMCRIEFRSTVCQKQDCHQIPHSLSLNIFPYLRNGINWCSGSCFRVFFFSKHRHWESWLSGVTLLWDITTNTMGMISPTDQQPLSLGRSSFLSYQSVFPSCSSCSRWDQSYTSKAFRLHYRLLPTQAERLLSNLKASTGYICMCIFIFNNSVNIIYNFFHCAQR